MIEKRQTSPASEAEEMLGSACYKVIVVGNRGVGKSSLLRRFISDEFVDEHGAATSTSCVEAEVTVRPHKRTVRLSLWDTSPDDADMLLASYFAGAAGFIVCFGVDDPQSFFDVATWKSKIDAGRDPSAPVVLCQTKSDLPPRISPEEVERLSISTKCPLFRSSSLKDSCVDQVFEYVAAQCLQADRSGAYGILNPVEPSQSLPVMRRSMSPSREGSEESRSMPIEVGRTRNHHAEECNHAHSLTCSPKEDEATSTVPSLHH